MSENYYRIECLAETPEELAPLNEAFSKLEEGVTPAGGPLAPFLADWDEPSVESCNLYGNFLVVNLVTSNHDLLEKSQIMTLHGLGASFVRVYVEYSQVGESRTYCYHAGKKISAKAFPKPMLDDAGKAYMFVQDGKDSSLAALVKAGLDPNLSIAGRPLFIHVCKGRLNITLAALLKAGVDLDICKDYPREIVEGIRCTSRKDAPKLLKALIASGADVSEVWRESAGCYWDAAMMAMLIEAGADINQRLAHWRGSLLFHSELFEDDPKVLALLERNGAQVIPPEPYRPSLRLERLIYGLRGAHTIEQLVADGVDLSLEVMREPAPVEALIHNPVVALGLIQAEANIDNWLIPSYFQDRVLPQMSFSRPEFSLTKEGESAVLKIFELLLGRGFDPDMKCKLPVYFQSSRCFSYAGSLFVLLMALCCAGHNRLAALRLPLAKCFVAHGVDINASGGKGELAGGLRAVHLQLGDGYIERFFAAGVGSLLWHLQQQGSDDPADQQLIEFLKDSGAQAIRMEEASAV
ncbi:MAG: hypothetical protein ACRCTL_01975 [Pseudomonas sp.]